MKKGTFSRIIVAYCLLFCSAISVWAMYIAQGGAFEVSDVINTVTKLFGGELLLLCIKRVAEGKTPAAEPETAAEEFTDDTVFAEDPETSDTDAD